MISIQNDINFKREIKCEYDNMALYGSIKERMHDFKELVTEGGYRAGNFRDYALRTMELYSSSDEDRLMLKKHIFTFIGNPVIADPTGSGDQIIINDLEQRIFERVKTRILDASEKTELNRWGALPLSDDKDEAKQIYSEIMEKGKNYITPISFNQLKLVIQNFYALPQLREQIIEGLFQGRKTEKKDFIECVCDVKGIPRKKAYESLFSYHPGTFRDTCFLTGGSSFLNITDLNTSTLILAVNPHTNTLRKNYRSGGLFEM